MLPLSVLRLTPCSTPFPYTTLFRSRRPREASSPRCRRSSHRSPGVDARRGSPSRRASTPGDRCDERLQRGDRKSTRLNSSHLVISYAVFCLKKKKILHTSTQLLAEP